MHCSPPTPNPPIQCWNSGEIACTRVQHCRRGKGEGLNKCRWICLARVKKRHKCKFVPRLLSMIVVASSHDATSPCDLLQGLVAGISPIVCADLQDSRRKVIQSLKFRKLRSNVKRFSNKFFQCLQSSPPASTCSLQLPVVYFFCWLQCF